MSLSQSCARTLVPFLARVVLAAIFIPAGWNKIMTEFTPTPEQAVRLRALGVLPGIVTSNQPLLLAASLQDETPTKEADGKGISETLDTPPLSSDPTPTAESQPRSPASPGASGTGAAIPGSAGVRSLHQITLAVDGAGFSSYAVIGAWVAALTELLGGSLILLGLFSRIWGLGLAITMGMGFYMTSLEIVERTWIFGANHVELHQIAAQLGLGVLALGVFLTGAGLVSMDHALFHRGAPKPTPKASPANPGGV